MGLKPPYSWLIHSRYCRLFFSHAKPERGSQEIKENASILVPLPPRLTRPCSKLLIPSRQSLGSWSPLTTKKLCAASRRRYFLEATICPQPDKTVFVV